MESHHVPHLLQGALHVVAPQGHEHEHEAKPPRHRDRLLSKTSANNDDGGERSERKSWKENPVGLWRGLNLSLFPFIVVRLIYDPRLLRYARDLNESADVTMSRNGTPHKTQDGSSRALENQSSRCGASVLSWARAHWSTTRTVRVASSLLNTSSVKKK